MKSTEIKAIRNYLNHHEIKEYDIQAELIDHFASAIEELRRKDPSLSFKDALYMSHRKFGGEKGFEQFIKSAEKSVQKKMWKVFLQLFISLFHWPYILFTVIVLFFWYSFNHYLQTPQMMNQIICIAFFISFLIIYQHNRIKLRRSNYFLSKRSNAFFGQILYFLSYIPMYPILISKSDDRLFEDTSMVIYLSLLSLAVYISLKLPFMLERECRKIIPAGF